MLAAGVEVFVVVEVGEVGVSVVALLEPPPPQALRVSAAQRVRICKAWRFWSCIMVEPEIYKNDSSELITLFYSTMS